MAAMRIRTILTAALLVAVAASHPASARPRDRDGMRDRGEYERSNSLRVMPPEMQMRDPLLDTRARLSPADAAREARQQYGGKVLNVAPASGGYRVRII